jgi:hypothetical protein
MQKNIMMPNNIAAAVEEIAASNNWRFSRTANYLIYLGLCHLKEISIIKEVPLYDVDKPSRKAIE